jgi:hypothetical protein
MYVYIWNYLLYKIYYKYVLQQAVYADIERTGDSEARRGNV